MTRKVIDLAEARARRIHESYISLKGEDETQALIEINLLLDEISSWGWIWVCLKWKAEKFKAKVRRKLRRNQRRKI